MRRILMIGLIAVGALALALTFKENIVSASADSADSTGDSTEMIADSGETQMSSDSSEESAEPADSTDSAKAPADTVTTESGLQYVITRAGKGPLAEKGQKVAVHYAGRLLADGKEFDNSYKRGAAFEFTLGRRQVIAGWDEGVAGMAVGEQRTLIIPWKLAYGENGHPSGVIPPKADLVFDVELVAIK